MLAEEHAATAHELDPRGNSIRHTQIEIDRRAEDAKPHEALYFAEKVKDAEDSVARAQQQFPDDADIIQVEAHLREMLDQENRALLALERAWAAGPRGAGTALRIARIYQARDRSEDAHKVLMDALNRNPDDKSVHYAIAMHYLQKPDYDQAGVNIT